jgi:hypothetical protein
VHWVYVASGWDKSVHAKILFVHVAVYLTHWSEPSATCHITCGSLYLAIVWPCFSVQYGVHSQSLADSTQHAWLWNDHHRFQLLHVLVSKFQLALQVCQNGRFFVLNAVILEPWAITIHHGEIQSAGFHEVQPSYWNDHHNIPSSQVLSSLYQGEEHCCQKPILDSLNAATVDQCLTATHHGALQSLADHTEHDSYLKDPHNVQ